MNGSSSCAATSSIEEPETRAFAPSSSETSSGESTTPIRFDSDAEQTAAATFPRAMDVNAIED